MSPYISRPSAQTKACLACQILNTCQYEVSSEALTDVFSPVNRIFCRLLT